MKRIHLSSAKSFERIFEKQAVPANSFLIFERIQMSSANSFERIEEKKNRLCLSF